VKIIEVAIEDELYSELQAAVSGLPMSPESWAAECVESVLATRRLPNVRPSVYAPRDRENMLATSPQMAEHRAHGYRPADVAAHELEIL
jgi:hypothetical protein